MLGSPGDDLITGSPAAVNHLDGRGGDDRLVLQQGGTLVGGPGDDTFVFAHEGLATAEIRDFTKGEDKIGSVTLNVSVSTLDTSDFILP